MLVTGASFSQGILSTAYAQNVLGDTLVLTGKTSTTATVVQTVPVPAGALNYPLTYISGKIIMANDSLYAVKFKVGTDSVLMTGVTSSSDYVITPINTNVIKIYFPSAKESAVITTANPISYGFTYTLALYNNTGTGTGAVHVRYLASVAYYTNYH